MKEALFWNRKNAKRHKITTLCWNNCKVALTLCSCDKQKMTENLQNDIELRIYKQNSFLKQELIPTAVSYLHFTLSIVFAKKISQVLRELRVIFINSCVPIFPKKFKCRFWLFSGCFAYFRSVAKLQFFRRRRRRRER